MWNSAGVRLVCARRFSTRLNSGNLLRSTTNNYQRLMSLKRSLKSAKVAIEANDPESVLEYVEEALELDTNCYFAYIFQGKAYQLLDDITDASKSFEKATSLEPDNILGWKGYLQVAKCGSDYPLYFSVLSQVIRIQLDQQVSIAETLKDLRNWLDFNQYKNNDELHELYLRQIIPGSELGNLVGSLLGNQETNLKQLIDLVKKRLDQNVSARLSKERVRFPRVLPIEAKVQLNQIAWPYYEACDLDSLYKEFLNIAQDEELRSIYEDQHLRYKYDMLKAATEKATIYQEIKEMIDGMVYVKTKSLFCWNLYFDWCDVSSLGDLDIEKVVYYLKTFPNEGLSITLYAFAMSEISPFDKQTIVKATSMMKKEAKNSIIDELDDESEKEQAKFLEDETVVSETNLLPGQILSLMLQGYAQTSESILANRIVCEYYIHLREYSEASDKCRESIKLLADLQRTFSIELIHTKESFLCSLAIIYTYYEAPKNFPRALQLYDRVLSGSPGNVKAKVGKGLILIEKDNLQAAQLLFQEVVQENPDDELALREFSWCLILLGDSAKGRETLLKSLTKVQGVDLYSAEIRAITNWRIAKSYLLENDQDENFVNEAYGHLITSLKESKNYAPSYTLLGIIFQDHFGDKQRAQKCFYKAFELDVNEITSAKYLVEDLAAQNEWEVAEVLCNRIVSTESSRRTLLSKTYREPDRSWPYRILGCSALNKQDDAKAIEWFQTALRMTSMDPNCWVGLGEAYLNCGRLDAAAKVFRHSLTLENDSWIVKYLLGLVSCQMGEFEEGLKFLHEALVQQPEEECILGALYESYIDNANHLLENGFFGRALASNHTALKYILACQKVSPTSQSLWKSLGESISIYLIIQEKVQEAPIDILANIFESLDFKSFEEKDESLENALLSFKKGEWIEALAILVILTYKTSIVNLPSKLSKYLRSISFYNLGLAYLNAMNLTESQSYKNLAIVYLKKAIQLEGNNSSFWIALGNAYVSSHPQISQHCFIKAISLETKDASVWTNLAALYLRYGDFELAQEAFLRAQSMAPQISQSWLGHALAAEAAGNTEDASRLFTHAFVLSNGRSPLAQYLYALSIIQKRVGNGSDPREIEAAQEFSVANFAMEKYLRFSPNEDTGLQIALTISERCKQFERAVLIGERLCAVYEAKYEKTESEVVLANYAKAKTQLARIYLGLSQYDMAIESAEFALNLAEDSEESVSVSLSSRIVIGLGLFFSEDINGALEQLKVILGEYSDSKRLVTLIAQILYAYGTEETKKAALDQLFAFIEEHGSSLIVVLTLGAMSVVDDLDEYFAAIKEELEGLALNELVDDTFRTVPKLLAEINKRLDNSDSDRIWKLNALLFPSDYNVWKNINSEMALSVASLGSTKLTASQLSEAYFATGNIRAMKRALFLLPGNDETRAMLAQQN